MLQLVVNTLSCLFTISHKFGSIRGRDCLLKLLPFMSLYKQNILNIPRSLLQILNFKADNRAAQHPQTQIHAAVNAAGWNFQ